MGQLVGYARVSTSDQDLSLQINDLKAAGCNHILTDKVSGTKTERPGLNECLKTLRSGDTLIVWRLDRLGRSMQHLVNVITELKARGIGFRSLKDGAIDAYHIVRTTHFPRFCGLGRVRGGVDTREDEGRFVGGKGTRKERRA